MMQFSAPPTVIDVQEFTVSGTWTNPQKGNIAIVELWAGGGSGGHGSISRSKHGGGGGDYIKTVFQLSTLGATEAVIVGAGGASVTAGDGNAGGDSSFGVLVARGGVGGQADISTIAATIGSNPRFATELGGEHEEIASTGSSDGTTYARTFAGGGGASIRENDSTTGTAAGTSVYGGDGGVQGMTTDGGDGGFPAGGGGAMLAGAGGVNSGAGAAGFVRVTVI